MKYLNKKTISVEALVAHVVILYQRLGGVSCETRLRNKDNITYLCNIILVWRLMSTNANI
jgi:hypothetical protein